MTATNILTGSGSSINASNKKLSVSVTAVITGSTFSPSSANVSCHFPCASLFLTKALLFSLNEAAESVNPCFDISSKIKLTRSLSLEQFSSFLLNSSSLVPAQFNTSANVPVTCPTLTVSLIASANPSIGMESPYRAHAPIVPSVIVFKSF